MSHRERDRDPNLSHGMRLRLPVFEHRDGSLVEDPVASARGDVDLTQPTCVVVKRQIEHTTACDVLQARFIRIVGPRMGQ